MSRPGSAGGTGPVAGGSTGAGVPAVDTSGADIQGMSYQEIMPKLHGLDPDQFAAASKAFGQLESALDNITASLRRTGESFAANQSWRGAAAQKAMDKFQDMHDQASVLSAQCSQAKTSLSWFSDATRPYQQIPDPQVVSATKADEIMAAPLDALNPVAGAGGAWVASKLGIGPDGQNTADKAARDYMNSYNQQLAKLDKSLPNDQNPQDRGGQNFSHPGSSQQGSGSGSGAGQLSGSGSAGGVPGSATGGAGANVPGYSSRSSANPFASSQTAKAPSITPANASLQGYTPPPTGTGSPFAGASPGGAGGSANPFARMAPMPGGVGAGALGERIPGEESPGKSGLSEGEAGVKDAAAEGTASGEGVGGEAARAEAAGAREGAGGGMPMGGAGGGGDQDKERQRQAWMNEDQSIWGVPDEDVGPIIG